MSTSRPPEIPAARAPSNGRARARYVQVAVNAGRPTFQTFSYRVPPDRQVLVGEVVHVPWGQRTLQGVVIEGPTEFAGYSGEIRDIEPAVAGAPVLSPERLALAAWIADYYLAPQWESYALMLPPGAGERPQTVVVRGPKADKDIQGRALSERQQQLFDLLTEQPRDVDELRSELGKRGFDAALVALVRRGLAERRYFLARPRGRPRIAEVLRLAVPPERALAASDAIEGRRASRRARALRALLEAGDAIEFSEVAKIARGAPAVETLVGDGLLARDGDQVRLTIDADAAKREIRRLTRTRAQEAAAALLDRMAAAPDEPIPIAGLAAEVGTGASDGVRWLQGAGLASVEEVLDRRDPLREVQLVTREPLELIGEQRAAAVAITQAIDRADGTRYLLHGVTGSGKTEVYLDALTHAVALGRRGIVLVPEIALTPQTVRRFAERFPGRVGVLHSGLSLGEAFDEWHAIAEGAYDVVIGSRSAIFAPQPNLGLIVVDEAHEWTYKQVDPAPRYDARTVAEQLAQRSGAALVMGTATPDAERWFEASEGRLQRLDLPRRVRAVRQPDGTVHAWPGEQPPEVEVVDVRGARRLFSDTLVEALAETLDRDEQAILFLNRRGLAGHLLCPNGHFPACSSCDVALALHDPPGRLVCHLCNRSRRVPDNCEECSSRLRPARAGTQRVEREVTRLFPAARVARWDRDTARTAAQHEALMGRFMRQEADVLVGTQMVAKGLDLPMVTLVGVVLADYGLHAADFRASERTFQLLEQVGGRAGRAERHGRVIIQTLDPEHPAIVAAATHDIDGFYEEELRWRAQFDYPPFRRLARLLFAHANGDYAAEEASRLAAELRRRVAGEAHAEVLGPTRPFVARLRGRHRWQLLLRADDPAEVLRELDLAGGWTVDIDPVVLS